MMLSNNNNYQFGKISQCLSLGILLLLVSCKPKEKLIDNISCDGKLIVQYDKKNYKRVTIAIAPKGSKIITVIFLSEYKDSIRGYLDNKLLFNEFVDQRDDDHSKKYNFIKSYPKNSKPILKIESITKKTCFDVEIDRRYSYAYIWLDEKGNWQIRFSNSFYLV